MSEIELKVGQVWKNGNILMEVVKLTKRMVYYFSENGIYHSVRSDSQENFINDNTLITNADGTPYVKPNVYRHGDVWAFYGNSDTPDNSYLIKFVNGHLRAISKQLDLPLSETALKGEFQSDYRLIYRDGKVITNDKTKIEIEYTVDLKHYGGVQYFKTQEQADLICKIMGSYDDALNEIAIYEGNQ